MGSKKRGRDESAEAAPATKHEKQAAAAAAPAPRQRQCGFERPCWKQASQQFQTFECVLLVDDRNKLIDLFMLTIHKSYEYARSGAFPPCMPRRHNPAAADAKTHVSPPSPYISCVCQDVLGSLSSAACVLGSLPAFFNA